MKQNGYVRTVACRFSKCLLFLSLRCFQGSLFPHSPGWCNVVYNYMDVMS